MFLRQIEHLISLFYRRKTTDSFPIPHRISFKKLFHLDHMLFQMIFEYLQLIYLIETDNGTCCCYNFLIAEVNLSKFDLKHVFF